MTYIKDKVVVEGTLEDPPNHNSATVTTMYESIVQQYLVVFDDNPRSSYEMADLGPSDPLAH
jgi:hypothetical protein